MWTRSYGGFNLESQDIRNLLISYVENHMEEAMEQDLNPECLRMTEEEYAKDREVGKREALKKSVKEHHQRKRYSDNTCSKASYRILLNPLDVTAGMHLTRHSI